MVHRAAVCTNYLPKMIISARYMKDFTKDVITITLCGGQGRSLRLKLFVTKAIGPSPSASPRGPAIVASSPGAKAIIVEDMITPPHWSVAWIP